MQCPRRLASAQAEAGMVPRAADGVADHQALGERPVIVGAGRADGEQLVAAPRQQHRLFADVACNIAPSTISVIATPTARSGPDVCLASSLVEILPDQIGSARARDHSCFAASAGYVVASDGAAHPLQGVPPTITAKAIVAWQSDPAGLRWCASASNVSSTSSFVICAMARAKRGRSDSPKLTQKASRTRPLDSFRARLRNVSAQVGRQAKQAAAFLEIILRGLCRPVALQFCRLGPAPALCQRKAKFAVLTKPVARKPENLTIPRSTCFASFERGAHDRWTPPLSQFTRRIDVSCSCIGSTILHGTISLVPIRQSSYQHIESGCMYRHQTDGAHLCCTSEGTTRKHISTASR